MPLYLGLNRKYYISHFITFTLIYMLTIINLSDTPFYPQSLPYQSLEEEQEAEEEEVRAERELRLGNTAYNGDETSLVAFALS